jgi:hypothetical protein
MLRNRLFAVVVEQPLLCELLTQRRELLLTVTLAQWPVVEHQQLTVAAIRVEINCRFDHRLRPFFNFMVELRDS